MHPTTPQSAIQATNDSLRCRVSHFALEQLQARASVFAAVGEDLDTRFLLASRSDTALSRGAYVVAVQPGVAFPTGLSLRIKIYLLKDLVWRSQEPAFDAVAPIAFIESMFDLNTLELLPPSPSETIRVHPTHKAELIAAFSESASKVGGDHD